MSDRTAFTPETRAALQHQGWRFATIPRDVDPTAGEVAYRPGLMPGSPGLTLPAAAQLLLRLDGILPAGARSGIGSAAEYEWLLQDHHARTGEWLLPKVFTWTTDTDPRGYPIAVGSFPPPAPSSPARYRKPRAAVSASSP